MSEKIKYVDPDDDSGEVEDPMGGFEGVTDEDDRYDDIEYDDEEFDQ